MRLPASGWFDMPTQALRRIEVCANDGYLPFHGCEATQRLGAAGQPLRCAQPSQPARESRPARRGARATATVNRPAACRRPTGSYCRPPRSSTTAARTPNIGRCRRARRIVRPRAGRPAGAGAALSRVRMRACSSRASSTAAAVARCSRPSPAPGGHDLLASRQPIPWRNAHFSPAVVGHRPGRAHTDPHG